MRRARFRPSSMHRLPWRLVPAILLVLIVASLALGPSLPGSWTWRHGQERSQAAVATDGLNLRAAPTLDSAVLAVLPSGEQVEVVGNVEHGYAPVRYQGSSGWLAVEYLSFGERVSAGEPAVVSAAESPGLEADTSDPEPGDSTTSSGQHSASTERWIDINRTNATVTLFEGDTAITVFPGRIGRDQSAEGFYSTAIGTYHVYSMNEGLAPTPFADNTYLTDWVGFDPVRHNGIHSPVRNADGSIREWQNATTLGCVRLSAEDAKTVFAFAHIGMRVEVHD